MSFFFNFDENVLKVQILLQVIILIFLWHRKHTLSYLFYFTIFWTYLSLALQITIFPIPTFSQPLDMSFWRGVNLNPLYFGPSAQPKDVWLGLILNIILTIPFGFGINFILPCSPRRIFWMALAVGLTFEGLQLIISLWVGFPYRIIDIHDFLSNAAGVYVGYFIFTNFSLCKIDDYPRSDK